MFRSSPPSVGVADISPQGWRLVLNLHPWGEMSPQVTEGGASRPRLALIKNTPTFRHSGQAQRRSGIHASHERTSKPVLVGITSMDNHHGLRHGFRIIASLVRNDDGAGRRFVTAIPP